jgi:hypothetical protein
MNTNSLVAAFGILVFWHTKYKYTSFVCSSGLIMCFCIPIPRCHPHGDITESSNNTFLPRNGLI